MSDALFGRQSIPTFAAIALILVAIPIFGSRSAVILATEFCSVLAIAMMWNVLAGFAGVVLIGMQLFVGVGGYTLYVCANAVGIPPYPFIAIAGLTSGLLAWAIAPVLFRLSGAQLAIGSWVMAEIARLLTLQSQALGAGGGLNLEVMKLVPRGARLILNYCAAASILVACLVVVLLLMRGRFGLALRALRGGEAAAEAMGVDTRRTRSQAFVLSAGLTGAAGGTYYISALQITPGSAFSINWMAIVIFVTVLGGIGTVEGPICGAIFYFMLRETLSGSGSVYFVVSGVLAIGVVTFLPSGVWGLLRRLIGSDLLPVTRSSPNQVSDEASGRSTSRSTAGDHDRGPTCGEVGVRGEPRCGGGRDGGA